MRQIRTWDAGMSATNPDYMTYVVWIVARADADTAAGETLEVSWFMRHHFKDI